jgi:predicted transcriptional regulator
MEVFDFIQKHNDLIIHTNPYDLHLLIGLYESFVERKNESYIWYSTCFAIPPFLCDVLKLKAPINGIRYDFVPQLKPGNYYFFNCFDHEFSIVYLDDKTIYCIDYYSETQRSHPFRLERFSLEKIKIFIEALMKNDINGYVKFHGGNASYEETFKEDFQRIYEKYPELAKLVNEVYEQKLNSYVTIEDVFRVLLKENPSFPMSDIDSIDYTEEDFENKPANALQKATEIYQSYLGVLKNLPL